MPKGPKPKDRTGEVHGRLTILKMLPDKSESGLVQWVAKCECGNLRICTSQYFAVPRASPKECISCTENSVRLIMSESTKKIRGGGLTPEPPSAILHALVHLNQFFTNPVIPTNQNENDQNPQMDTKEIK